MKLKSAIIGLMALTASASAGSYVYVPDILPIGCIEIGGEYLYWKPCTRAFDYGIEVKETGAITILSRTPGYDSGFRIFGMFNASSGCSYAGAEWVRLHATKSSLTPTEDILTWVLFGAGGGDNAPIDVEGAEGIKTRIKHNYDKVNAYWGYHLLGYDCSRLYGYIGVRYLSIEREGRAFGEEPAPAGTPVAGWRQEKSRFQGWGAQVGLKLDQDLGCGFELNAKLAATLASGSQKTRFLVKRVVVNEGTVTEFPLQQDLTTICVPGAEFEIALSYTYNCSCFAITGRVGYGIDYYVNALRRYADPIGIIRNADGSVASAAFEFQRIDVAFAGPFAGLSVCF